MSYQGYDKWTSGGKPFSEEAPTLRELKKKLIDHIKTFGIDCCVSDFNNVDYEIINVKLTIKKKKKV